MDLPLNTYWHKATLTPDNFKILKDNFRKNLVPGSAKWNEVVYRHDLERWMTKKWPNWMRHMFVRSENELLTDHTFRCTMMDHSALDEYWRLGQNTHPFFFVFSLFFCVISMPSVLCVCVCVCVYFCHFFLFFSLQKTHYYCYCNA